jgi:hypothetical protein
MAIKIASLSRKNQSTIILTRGKNEGGGTAKAIERVIEL